MFKTVLIVTGGGLLAFAAYAARTGTPAAIPAGRPRRSPDSARRPAGRREGSTSRDELDDVKIKPVFLPPIREPRQRKLTIGHETKKNTKKVTAMTISPTLKKADIDAAWEHIKSDRGEGFRTHAYEDTLGFWTIGHGLKIHGKGDLAHRDLKRYLNRKTPITEEESERIGKEITAANYNEVAGLFPNWDKLQKRQRTGLLEMAYQLGARGLANFRKTVGLINAGDYTEAGLEAGRSQWAIQTPERAARIAIDISNGTLTRADLPWVD